MTSRPALLRQIYTEARPFIDRLQQVLNYDPLTGVICRRDTGRPAGSVNHDGYIRIMVDGRRYRAHRIAWLFAHGRWPVEALDHINGNRTDNRLCNLREATITQNNHNVRLSTRNKSGVKGVYQRRRSQKWIAQITVNGKVHVLGYFLSREEATAVRTKAVRDLHGDFGRIA